MSRIPPVQEVLLPETQPQDAGSFHWPCGVSRASCSSLLVFGARIGKWLTASLRLMKVDCGMNFSDTLDAVELQRAKLAGSGEYDSDAVAGGQSLVLSSSLLVLAFSSNGRPSAKGKLRAAYALTAKRSRGRNQRAVASHIIADSPSMMLLPPNVNVHLSILCPDTYAGTTHQYT